MLGKIDVIIKGVCPLLMNRDTGIRTPVKDPGSPENQKKEFEVSQYRNSKGKLVQPAEHLEKALELAGNQFVFKGKSRYGKILCGGIFIDPQEIPHVTGAIKKVVYGEPIPFAKMVRIPPKTGSRVLKNRARVENWQLEFTINVVNDAINFDALKDILIHAGAYIGISDWRPKYGRFEVIKFEKAKGAK